MADDRRITVSFNEDEQDLKTAYHEILAEERKRDKKIPKDAVAKKLMRRGLAALADGKHAAAIAEGDLAVIKGQVGEIAKTVRMLEGAMRAIREDLATTVLVLLQHAGKLGAENAEKWVDEQFNR